MVLIFTSWIYKIALSWCVHTGSIETGLF